MANIFSKSLFTKPEQKLHKRLLILATIFLFLNAIALTISPAVRERSWNTDLLWSHWIGFLIWLIVVPFAHHQIQKYYPESDPFLFPIASLLTGWGIMTIWRLIPEFGLRQAIWLIICGILFIYCLRLPANLNFLRKYKYLWLISGLLLTMLTFVFGVNPLGSGPRLWLGCCGIYFQPSEPLKLLLVIYLAAYFADRIPLRLRILPMIVPTIIVTGVALSILFFQRDLGTASIFIFLYTSQLFIASGNKKVLFISFFGVVISAILGYYLFDVVRIRVDAWINPWVDPSGRSYQIVQSLLAIANGGLFGRGPGGGSPSLVPVAISDFIFSAISEEFGLIGTLPLLALIGVFCAKGIQISIHSTDRFRRYLAAGLTTYIISQSILIIGGNLRFLPLTGVTLPYVSYGGSSLLTSFIALLLLIIISNKTETEPFPLPKPEPFLLLGNFLMLGLIAVSLTNGWWSFWRGPDLLSRTDNARRSISDRFVKRGSILARQNEPINITEGISGSYSRSYLYPDLSPVTGYTNNIFGQAGLEFSLDDYLRGLQGNNSRLVWWDHLLYGQPPPGLDVRLSINLDLQNYADGLMMNHKGAIVMLNAASGEILVMSSHPNFDPNNLDEIGLSLNQDVEKPLLNRAAQGLYPPGDIIKPFIIAAGLKEPLIKESLTNLYEGLGFFENPNLRLPVAQAANPTDELLISPLQMVLAASVISNDGVRPPARLAMAVDSPQLGWIILPALNESVRVLPSGEAEKAIKQFLSGNQPYWEFASTVKNDHMEKKLSWFIAGTAANWQGTPLAVVVLLEETDLNLTQEIGQSLIRKALQP